MSEPIPEDSGTQTDFVAYLITNQLNGHRYVGITSRGMDIRWEEHLSSAAAGDGYYLHNAIRLYGPEVFSIEQVGIAGSWESLCGLEKELIVRFDTFHFCGNGYNLTRGGDGHLGWVPTEETRRKLRESAVRRWSDPAFAEPNAARAARHMMALWSRPDFVIARVAAVTAQHSDPEFAAARDARLAEWNSSPENIAHRQARWEEWNADPANTTARDTRLREWNAIPENIAHRQARWEAWNADPENAAAMSARMKAQWTAPAFLEAVNASLEKQWTDPDFVSRASERMKALHARPEFSAAISANMRVLHTRPEFASARDARLAEWNANPESAAVTAAAIKAYRADPAVAAAYSERMGAMRSDPDFMSKLLAAKARRSAEIDLIDPDGAPVRKAQRDWRAALKSGDRAAASALRKVYRRLDAERKRGAG